MRGAPSAPLLLTTILFVTADKLDILDKNDDFDVSMDSDSYSEDISTTFYSNIIAMPAIPRIHAVVAIPAKPNKPLEEKNPNFTGSQKRNSFFYAMQCYSCVGCKEVSGLTNLKSCPFTSDISKQNKCIVYAEKYNYVDDLWYIRGCASEHNSCAEMKQLYTYHKGIETLASCEECEGDRCNKSSLTHSPSFTSLAFFVIIAPLIAKYTLS